METFQTTMVPDPAAMVPDPAASIPAMTESLLVRAHGVCIAEDTKGPWEGHTMKALLRYCAPLAAVAAVAAFAGAPVAAAAPVHPASEHSDEIAAEHTNEEAAERANELPPNQLLPRCTDVGGDSWMGGVTTECASVGNSEIDATPGYPEGGMFYGPLLW